MAEFDTSELDEDEFLHRQLCPDGSCIGVLGSDGKCKECGMVDAEATTDPRLRGFKKESVDTPPPEALARVQHQQSDAAEDDAPPDFDDRRLCPDGACIGVVGPDGICGECGAVA